MKKLFLGVYHPSVILTYIGALVSVFGIFGVNDLHLATILLMVAGLCDAFDGIFARMYKRTKLQEDFGVQIDSLADLISFGVFPAKIYRAFFSDCVYVSTVLLGFYMNLCLYSLEELVLYLKAFFLELFRCLILVYMDMLLRHIRRISI